MTFYLGNEKPSNAYELGKKATISFTKLRCD